MLHGVLCAFYMLVVVTVNREMVVKDGESLANITPAQLEVWNQGKAED